MTTTLPRRSRVPRWAKVLLGVLGVALVVTGAAVAWFVTLLAGGLDDLVDGRRVQAGDARVVAAQERSERALSAELAEVVGGRPEQVLARTSVGECTAGQHNWKVDDDHDLACEQGAAVLLRGEPQRLPDDVQALHEQLLAQGWAPAPSHRDRDTPLRGAPAALALTPSGTAGAGYLRGGTRLSVVWFDRDDEAFLGSPYTSATWDVPDRLDVGSDRLATTVPAGAYGLVLAVTAESFRA